MDKLKNMMNRHKDEPSGPGSHFRSNDSTKAADQSTDQTVPSSNSTSRDAKPVSTGIEPGLSQDTTSATSVKSGVLGNSQDKGTITAGDSSPAGMKTSHGLESSREGISDQSSTNPTSYANPGQIGTYPAGAMPSNRGSQAQPNATTSSTNEPNYSAAHPGPQTSSTTSGTNPTPKESTLPHSNVSQGEKTMLGSMAAKESARVDDGLGTGSGTGSDRATKSSRPSSSFRSDTFYHSSAAQDNKVREQPKYNQAHGPDSWQHAHGEHGHNYDGDPCETGVRPPGGPSFMSGPHQLMTANMLDPNVNTNDVKLETAYHNDSRSSDNASSSTAKSISASSAQIDSQNPLTSSSDAGPIHDNNRSARSDIPTSESQSMGQGSDADKHGVHENTSSVTAPNNLSNERIGNTSSRPSDTVNARSAGFAAESPATRSQDLNAVDAGRGHGQPSAANPTHQNGPPNFSQPRVQDPSTFQTQDRRSPVQPSSHDHYHRDEPQVVPTHGSGSGPHAVGEGYSTNQIRRPEDTQTVTTPATTGSNNNIPQGQHSTDSRHDRQQLEQPQTTAAVANTGSEEKPSLMHRMLHRDHKDNSDHHTDKNANAAVAPVHEDSSKREREAEKAAKKHDKGTGKGLFSHGHSNHTNQHRQHDSKTAESDEQIDHRDRDLEDRMSNTTLNDKTTPEGMHSQSGTTHDVSDAGSSAHTTHDAYQTSEGHNKLHKAPPGSWN